MKEIYLSLTVVLTAGLIVVQLQADTVTDTVKNTVADTIAHAKMISKNGSDVEGSFDFKETSKGIEVKYKLTGLPKNKTIGLHIHEIGDCSSSDAKSAGGHFAKVAPTGGTSKDFPGRYAGDLPAIKTDLDGQSTGTFIAPDLVITSTMSSENSIKNRAIIIHGDADNLNQKSAPRIACGKIEIPNKADTTKN